jgi:hypothetical protein
VVDGELNCQWIIPGFHYVNRVCYLMTERAHRYIPVEFRVRNDVHTLTRLGLLRQIRSVERLISERAQLAA